MKTTVRPGTDDHLERGRRMEENGLGYVAWGGKRGVLRGEPIDLGWAISRGRKGWAFHFCYGYVNGFPIGAIIYYLLTRHTTNLVWHLWNKYEPRMKDRPDYGLRPCRAGCRYCPPVSR